MISKITIRTKIALGFGLVIATFLISSLLAISQVNVLKNSDLGVQDRYKQMLDVKDLDFRSMMITLTGTDIIIDKDSGVLPEYKRKINEIRSWISANRQEILDIGDTSFEKRSLGQIFSNLQMALDIIERQLVPAVNEKRNDEAFLGKIDDKLRELGSRNKELIKGVINSIQHEVDKSTLEMAAAEKRAYIILIAMLLAGIAIGITVTIEAVS